MGPSRQLHSQLSQRPGPQGSTHSLSVFSCVGGCTYPSPCLTAPANEAAYSTSLATIAQRVPRQGRSECAAAQVCREGGARVTTNMFVRDMDLAAHNALDNRRLEVVADGLTLWRGAQLAIDTTLVSPLRRDGTARARAANHDGAALEDARRRKEATYPELSGERWESSPRGPGS